MSEVKRYHVTDSGLVEGQALGRINVVLGPDYDSAVQCFLTAAEGCVAAERRERALQTLLTAADERADTATSLVQRYVDNFDTEIECYEDIQPNDLEHDQVLAEMRVFLAELKPEPSGGDSARLALRPENQRITPARFKCLACGEYHEGSGNLPCPSMSPYSRIEP